MLPMEPLQCVLWGGETRDDGAHPRPQPASLQRTPPWAPAAASSRRASHAISCAATHGVSILLLRLLERVASHCQPGLLFYSLPADRVPAAWNAKRPSQYPRAHWLELARYLDEGILIHLQHAAWGYIRGKPLDRASFASPAVTPADIQNEGRFCLHFEQMPHSFTVHGV
jgi:hypothetical protein